MNIEPTQALICIVEDNADNLFILSDILLEELHVARVEGVGSGDELFALFTNEPKFCPDLILLDLQIPQEDGYAVLRKIRRTSELTTVLVVAVTANVLPQDVERCRSAGFDGFLGKPINSDRFPDQITRILRHEPIWEV